MDGVAASRSEQIDIRIKDVADWCLSRGISVIPIGQDKKPAVKWGEYIKDPMQSWDFPGCNIAIITGDTNGLAVIDCDNQQSWLAWEAEMPPTPMRVKSRRGMHYWYRMPDCYLKSGSHLKLEGKTWEYDVKGSRSYVLMPPSIAKGHQYSIWPTKENPTATWIDPKDLPLFDMAWRPELKGSSQDFSRKEIHDVKSYISKIHAIEGNGGDKMTYKVCCLIQESGATQMEAAAIILEWNKTNATPAWPVEDLLKKLERVYYEAQWSECP